MTACGATPANRRGLPAEDVVLLEAPPKHPWRSAVMVAIGAVAAMAVVAWVVLLLSPASDHPMPSATSDTQESTPRTLPGQNNAVPSAANAAGRAIVELAPGRLTAR